MVRVLRREGSEGLVLDDLLSGILDLTAEVGRERLIFVDLVGREGTKSPAEDESLPRNIGNLGERALNDLMEEDAKKLGLPA